MHDKTMLVSFDTYIRFVSLDQKRVGLVLQALPFLRCSWTHLIRYFYKGDKFNRLVFLSWHSYFSLFQAGETNIKEKLFKLVAGLSGVNEKQKQVRSKINRLSQKINNLTTLTFKQGQGQGKVKKHLQSIRQSLRGLNQNMNQLSSSKVRVLEVFELCKLYFVLGCFSFCLQLIIIGDSYIWT